MEDTAEENDRDVLPSHLQEQLREALAKRLEGELLVSNILREDGLPVTPRAPPGDTDTGGVQLFARVAPGSEMLPGTNRTLAPESQHRKVKRRKLVKLKPEDWEQLAVSSQSIVTAAAKAAHLALPFIGPDIRTWAQDTPQRCHTVRLPLTLRQQESSGPPAAVLEAVKLDDAVRSQCLHYERSQREQREEERLERERLAALRSARRQLPKKAKTKGAARLGVKRDRKPLTPAQTRTLAEDIFAQLIGSG